MNNLRFEIGEVLTLENNRKYGVSQQKVIDGKTYLLLIEIPSMDDFKYVEIIDNENLREIKDVKAIEQLSAAFLGNK